MGDLPSEAYGFWTQLIAGPATNPMKTENDIVSARGYPKPFSELIERHLGAGTTQIKSQPELRRVILDLLNQNDALQARVTALEAALREFLEADSVELRVPISEMKGDRWGRARAALSPTQPEGEVRK